MYKDSKMNVFDKILDNILKIIDLEDEAHRVYTDVCNELLNKYATEDEKVAYSKRLFNAANLHIKVIHILHAIAKEIIVK